MNFLNILLSMGATGGGGDSTSLFMMLGLMAVVFWLFMFRPQQKRQKEIKKFRSELDKGSRVVTIGGIHGKIVGVQDSTFLLELEGGNRIKVEKSAISKEYTDGVGESELSESSTVQK